MLSPWKKSYDKPRQHIKKQRHSFADKGLPSQSYDFSCSYVWMWLLDYRKSWELKKWSFELCCWRRFLRVIWTARRSSQSILKEISPKYSLEELMLKLKLQYFGPPESKNQLIGKNPDAGKDWGQKEKGATENEIVEWHLQLNEYGLSKL